MNIIMEFIEKIKTIYLPAYFQWLTEKLSNSEPFEVLTYAVIVVLALVVYLWFRNRD